uniref:Uncharacterized protein n=1 Tax=Rhizophora mucronata TaxID=61149 RepID=A0A2P2PDZ9_RHIMU
MAHFMVLVPLNIQLIK